VFFNIFFWGIFSPTRTHLNKKRKEKMKKETEEAWCYVRVEKMVKSEKKTKKKTCCVHGKRRKESKKF
jgi:hypothetical protein